MDQPSKNLTRGLGVAAVLLAVLGVAAALVKDPQGDTRLAATGPDTPAVVDETEATTADPAPAEDPTSTTVAPSSDEPSAPDPGPAAPAGDAEFEAFMDWLPDGMLAYLDLGEALLEAADVESDADMAAVCADVEGLIPETRAVVQANPVASIRDPYLEGLDHLATAVELCQDGLAGQDWAVAAQVVQEFETAGALIEASTEAMVEYFVAHGIDPGVFA